MRGDALGEDRLLVGESVRVLRLVRQPREGRGGHLVRVAAHDRAAPPPHRADGGGHGDLRSLVEDHDIEVLALGGEEARHGVRGDEHARGDVRDDVPVLADQVPDPAGAHTPRQLALEVVQAGALPLQALAVGGEGAGD